jgi:hypothetical protein
VLLAVAVIVTPTVMLGSQFGDSVHELVNGVRDNTLRCRRRPTRSRNWPVVGKKVHALWSQAHNDLPALVKSMQPKIGELAGKALGIVASLGGGLLKFMFSFIVAGIMMAFGESGGLAMQAIFERFAGVARGAEFAQLVDLDGARRCLGGHRHRLHPGAVGRHLADHRGRPVRRRALALVVLVLGVAQVPAAGDAAGHRLDVDERRLRDRPRPSPIAC